jgi:hypothetical protein
VKDRLRTLDDRHLPRLARWLRMRVNRAEVARDRVSATAKALEPQSLDARYAGHPPFSAMRSKPFIGLALAAALLAAGLATAVVQEGRDDNSASGDSSGELSGQGDAPEGTLLGPRIGEPVRDYLKRATDGLVDAVRVAPGTARVALVSLTNYRTPSEARVVLSGFDVKRVFLRARAAGKEATTLPIDVRGDVLSTLRRAYAETARSRAEAQRSYEGYVRTLRPRSSQDRAFRDLYAAFAHSAGIEAREYGRSCACVMSALVVASPAQLLTLNARAGIRAVQVARPRDTVLQVQAQPLLPEVTGVVPKPAVAGFG